MRALAVTGCALALLLGCTRPRTQVMVVVTADATLRARIDELQIIVEGGASFDTLARASDEILPARFPATHGLVPANGDATRVYRVTVIGLEARSQIVTARAESGYVPGATKRLEIHLTASCESISCSESQTCEDGTCTTARIDAASLPDFTTVTDGGVVDDGGDVGSDTGTLDTGPPAVCGDSRVTAPEMCDDGNETEGDGCDASCNVETGYSCVGEPSVCAMSCGDGVVDSAFEECDDGANIDFDGCTACVVDHGFACVGEPSVCASTCGDGEVASDEACDDMNVAVNDGCSGECAIETGWECDAEPSVCSEVCGDDMVVGREECDDGDVVPGDGCDAMCRLEPPPPPGPRDLVITEIMFNPDTVPDAQGEWFEVENVSGVELELMGCEIRDFGTDFDVIGASLRVAPGARLTFATSTLVGFAADHFYSGINLANGEDEIRILCGGVLIDEVQYRAIVWPGGPDTAMSLDPTLVDALVNDDLNNWCDATTTYAGGGAALGSPGGMNPPCP